MDVRELLVDHFGRVTELYAGIALPSGRPLDAERAHHRPGGTGNPVVWLLWHVARLQDDHVAHLTGTEQAWRREWADRIEVPYDRDDIGYGHTSAEVAALRVDRLEDLVAYQAAVHQLTLSYLDQVDPASLDRVVDRRFTPPVTAGVRLVSLLGDCLQHLGQAAYIEGLRGD